MKRVILHVEDDPSLRAMIDLSLHTFGFAGKIVTAGTVADGKKRLDRALRDGRTFDLIISDMHLPDGEGLDIVRYVRASAAWTRTPIVILSGDVDASKVSLAYSLGANAYVDKSFRGRSFTEGVKTLYQHWMKDVVLPVAPHAGSDASTGAGSDRGREQEAVARALSIRLRYAQIYQRVADTCVETPSEAAFWLSRVISESNLVNMISFLEKQRQQQHQPAMAELDAGLVQEIEAMQLEMEQCLTRLEDDLERGALSTTQIHQRLIDLLSVTDIELVARSIGRLFPVALVGVEALRDFLTNSIEDVGAWVELHTSDRGLRTQAAALRAGVAAVMRHAAAGASQAHNTSPQ